MIAVALMPLTLAGGGLLGGIGLIPIALGCGLALFSVIVLLLTWQQP